MLVRSCCHRKPPNELKPGDLSASTVGCEKLLEQVCTAGFDGCLLSSLAV
jgi:hypothetical protein